MPNYVVATAASFSPASAAAAPYGGSIQAGIPIFLDHDFDRRTDIRCTLGSIIRYFFLGPTGYFWYDYDLVMIDLSQGQAYIPRTTAVYFATSIDRPQQIYKVSSTTGVTCGTIEPQEIHRVRWSDSADEYNDTSNNLRVFNWSADLYIKPGDSGGPVYMRNGKYGNYVFGIVSGHDVNGASIAPLAPIAELTPR